ncbi:MAG: rhamnan synthesis F family protein, partial [Parvularcula sp.]|nr:rhamnan synthesis F family protein [Parvularcula sp.]
MPPGPRDAAEAVLLPLPRNPRRATDLEVRSAAPFETSTDGLRFKTSGTLGPGFDLRRREENLAPGRYRLTVGQGEIAAPIETFDLAMIFEDAELSLPLVLNKGADSEARGFLIVPREALGLRLTPRLSAIHKGVFELSSIELEPMSKAAYYAGIVRGAADNPLSAARLFTAVGTKAATEGVSSAAALLRAVEAGGLAALRPPEQSQRLADGRDPYKEDPLLPLCHWQSGPADLKGDDVLFLTAYAPNGLLSEAHREMLRRYREGGFSTLLIINTDAYDPYLDPGPSEADSVLIRENKGFDFGGWRDALDRLGGISQARSLTLTNDSIWPLSGAKIETLRQRILSADADVVFLTRNQAVRGHGQSYFVTFRETGLSRAAFAPITELPYQSDKTRLIYEGEAKLSSALEGRGLRTASLFSTETKTDPTIGAWQELIGEGFPFLKLQLLRQGHLALESEALRPLLAAEDRPLLASHLSAVQTPSPKAPPADSRN